MTRETIEQLSGGTLGPAPFRHRSWLWWNAMRLSGLGSHWDTIASLRNEERASTKRLSTYLRSKATDEEWETFSRRMGAGIINDKDVLDETAFKSTSPKHRIWTKGGTWDDRSNFAKIIVLGEHIPGRPLDGRVQKALGEDGIQKLEREVYNVVDPDHDLVPECKRQAADYVRHRMMDVAGWTGYDRASWTNVSWFFQERVLDHDGWVHDWIGERGDASGIRPPYQNKKETDRWSW